MYKFIKIFFITYTITTFCSLSSNAQLVSDFRVNDDLTNHAHYAAKVGCDSAGNFVVVWYDERSSGNPRICGQIFNQYAQNIGDYFQVNNDIYQALPSLYVRKDGSFIVAWSVIQTKFRIFNKNGIPISDEIIISDTSGSITSIGGDSLGNFVIAWEQYNANFMKQVYCQILNSKGNLIGQKIKVNDDTGNNTHKNPSITVRQDGSFIVTWMDSRPPSMDNADDIYMQLFDKIGNKIGVNQRVNDDFQTANLQRTPKISSDTSSSFIISWTDNRVYLENSDIFAQMYFFNGNKNGNNFIVTQSSTDNAKGICNVVNRPNGEFLIAWSEFRPNIPLPYFQRYTDSGIRIGNDFLVTSEFTSANKYYSDVALFEDRIISVWADARNGPLDIYCNIRSYSNPDTTVNIIQTSSNIPGKFSLAQNYPNPFNNSTQINFEINQSGIYKLDVYDNLGQKINEVLNKNLSVGSYKINFESGSLSSGVYHYILSSPKERLVKSFVLLK